MKRISLTFVKWGTGLLAIGLLTGYGPLAHYLHGGVKIRCPWASIHAHAVLLGWVGLTLFGLVYRALPEWGTPSPNAVKLAKAQLWISIVSVLGIYANGIFGYRLLNRISPGFYYQPEPRTLNLWLSIDGAFLTLYGLGCLLFMLVLFGNVRYDEDAR